MSTTTIPTISQHRNAKDRLLAVADKIESSPDEWDQSNWSDGIGYTSPHLASDQASCGTFGCAAGWGAAATPLDQMLGERKRIETKAFGVLGFEEAGAFAFGIHEDVADTLFSGSYGIGSTRGAYSPAPKEIRAERMVKALRYLADMPWEKRRRSCRAVEIERIGKGLKPVA